MSPTLLQTQPTVAPTLASDTAVMPSVTTQILVHEPLVISASLVKVFKYWMDDKVQDAMNFKGELFALISTVAPQRRDQAYALAWGLAQEGLQVVITASQNGYQVWRNLRTVPVA